MDKIVSPYKNIKQYTRIKIEPYHMNSDIRNNMKMVLKKKIEKKCNKNGFIDEVYKIMEFSDGILRPENLDGSAIYNISYHCRICIPIEHTIIICRFEMLTSDYIFCRNGPLKVFNPKNMVDISVWDFPDGCMHKKLHKRLAVGEYVKVRINNKRINKNDLEINLIGRMLDYATPEEVEKYFGSTIVKNEVGVLNNEQNSEQSSEQNSEQSSEQNKNEQSSENAIVHTSKKKSKKTRKTSTNFII